MVLALKCVLWIEKQTQIRLMPFVMIVLAFASSTAVDAPIAAINRPQGNRQEGLTTIETIAIGFRFHLIDSSLSGFGNG